MSRRISFLLLGLTIAAFFFNLLFLWVHANIDSYFYWAIGEYFRTGTYPFLQPFVYTKPTTISPPLYGILLSALGGIPNADLLIHTLQLLLLGASAWLLYHLLRFHIKKPVAIIISCLFALFPTNIIYASNLMTENPSQFFVALWLYLVATGISKKQTRPLAVAVLLGAIAGLVKYNLLILSPLAGVYFFAIRKSWRTVHVIFPVLAALVIIGWVVVNHQITGVWGLYDTRGTQLYNQFVAGTKLLPPETHPALIRLRSLLPPGTEVTVPYWNIQEQLAQKLGYEWKAIDTVLFDVAWASVILHPFQYLIHSAKNFALVHYYQAPHWVNIANIGMTDLTGTDAPYCDRFGEIRMCAPLIMTRWSYPLWNAYVRVEMNLFLLLAPWAFYLLFLPSLAISLLRRSALSGLYALTYLVAVIPIAFTIHPDPRYIVPFYPLAILIIVTSLQQASNVIRNIGNSDQINKRNEKK